MLQKRHLNQLNKFNVSGLFLIILAYSPGVFKESFWSDDYAALIDTPGFVDHVLRDARPTSAGLLSLGFSLLRDPTNAWVLRFLALVALLLIFLFIEKSIKNSTHYNLGVFSIAIAFCLPSFQMYIHWTITWHFLWAALAGLYSFHFWSSRQILKKVLAVLLLVLALTAYPPTALFFFSVITVTNVLNESKSSKFFNEAIRGLVLLAISGLVSILTVSVTMQLASISPNRRVRLVTLTEIPDKIAWLFSRPFVVGLRPFTIDSPTPIFALITSLPILLILFFGVMRQSRQSGELFLYRASVIVLPLLLTLIPIMITSDNQIEFRLLSGYCWGVAAIASFFLLTEIKIWLRTLNASKKLERTVLLLVSTILSLVAIISVNLHYTQLFGGPYQKKNAFLNAKISSCFNERPIEKAVIIPPKEPFPSFPRLGVFSMSTDLASPWVPKPNVELLLRQRKINVPVVYLEIRPSNMKVAKTECVIDLEEFRKLLN